MSPSRDYLGNGRETRVVCSRRASPSVEKYGAPGAKFAAGAQDAGRVRVALGAGFEYLSNAFDVLEDLTLFLCGEFSVCSVGSVEDVF